MPAPIKPTTQVSGTRERCSFDVSLCPSTSRAVDDTKNLTIDIRASTYWVVDSYGICRAPGVFSSMPDDESISQVLLRLNPYHLIDFLTSYPR